ncbi:MAG: GNAT family N-acetyltransferase [Bacteroidetes bacterium]|nr:GNAT family N-acetyltransferase [Bacteroidota bacterium]
MREFRRIITPRTELILLMPEDLKWVHENMTETEARGFLGMEDEALWERQKRRYTEGYTAFNYSALLFAIYSPTEKRTIGAIGFHNWQTEHNRAELGYGMNREEDKNKGYMSEALTPVLAFGFQDLNLHRIEALISPDNLPSRRLVEKAGFKEEGFVKEHYLRNGVYYSSILYAQLQEEWKELQKK